MITAVALVAQPPLLLRELGGAQDPVADLRAAAVEAVRALLADAEAVVVMGAHGVARWWHPSAEPTVRGFGPAGEGEDVPLPLGVGAQLLREAGWTGSVELVTIGRDASREDLDELAVDLTTRTARTALLLMGDGSARRSVQAPGYLDERAFPFDEALAKALTEGDATALADLDVELAADLMVAGSSSFRLLGAVALHVDARPRAELTYRDDPFGVSYFVATWRF